MIQVTRPVVKFHHRSFSSTVAVTANVKCCKITDTSECSITSYRSDIVVYNFEASSVALLELTCPLDSEHHIEVARSHTDLF